MMDLALILLIVAVIVVAGAIQVTASPAMEERP